MPRGSALGALMEEDVGSTDTMRESAGVSQSAVLRGRRVAAGWVVSSVLASNLAARRQYAASYFLQRIGLDEKKRVLPGVFNAAGLIVPEPSIMPPPMPLFIDVDTGCEAEYMTTNGLRLLTVARVVAPTVLVRESARCRYAAGDGDGVGSRATGNGAKMSHARTGAS